jgi:hypothetical protein
MNKIALLFSVSFMASIVFQFVLDDKKQLVLATKVIQLNGMGIIVSGLLVCNLLALFTLIRKK